MVCPLCRVLAIKTDLLFLLPAGMFASFTFLGNTMGIGYVIGDIHRGELSNHRCHVRDIREYSKGQTQVME
jgi:hypothetical protein